MDNVFVRLKDLPRAIKGVVAIDFDGNYNVYINQCLDCEQQKETLAHEILHISNNHLGFDIPIELCEYEAAYQRR